METTDQTIERHRENIKTAEGVIRSANRMIRKRREKGIDTLNLERFRARAESNLKSNREALRKLGTE